MQEGHESAGADHHGESATKCQDDRMYELRMHDRGDDWRRRWPAMTFDVRCVEFK
jgi:hypothetical protein